MHERNPYAPPGAAVHDVVPHREPGSATDRFVPYGRRRPAGHGLEWIASAFDIFRQRPGLWIATVAVCYAAFIGLTLVPFVSLAATLCSPLLTALLAALAHAIDREAPSGIAQALHRVAARARPLLTVGASCLAIYAGCTAVMVLLDGPAWIEIAMGIDDPQILEGRLLMLLAYLLLMSVAGLAIVFAPALVMLNDVPPLPALAMSVAGAVKNLVPGILCTFLLCILAALSILPLGLGLLVTVPMSLIAIYTAYRDIFMESVTGPPSPSDSRGSW